MKREQEENGNKAGISINLLITVWGLFENPHTVKSRSDEFQGANIAQILSVVSRVLL